MLSNPLITGLYDSCAQAQSTLAAQYQALEANDLAAVALCNRELIAITRHQTIVLDCHAEAHAEISPADSRIRYWFYWEFRNGCWLSLDLPAIAVTLACSQKELSLFVERMILEKLLATGTRLSPDGLSTVFYKRLS